MAFPCSKWRTKAFTFTPLTDSMVNSSSWPAGTPAISRCNSPGRFGIRVTAWPG
jgi:hypothetical protein